MLPDTYDIVIVGGGPAGATLARLIDKKYKVALLDKKSEKEGGFRKPCGGLLAPDAQKIMAKFGLCIEADILASPQIFAVKTLDVESGLIKYYQRFYLNLDRHKFDMWLLSLAGEKKNVDVFHGACCMGISKTGNGFEVKYKSGDSGESILRCTYLVGADGSNSVVRKSFFRHMVRRYTSIQEWFRVDAEDPYFGAIFDEKTTDCYAWINYKNGYRILGAALQPKNPKERFQTLKQKLTKFGYSFGKPDKSEACMISRPSLTDRIICGKDNIFLVGESGGFISPSSLEGLSYAMETADALSTAFRRGGDILKTYKRLTLKLRLKLFAKLFKLPFMYLPFLRRLVMRSRFLAIKTSENGEG